MKLIKFMKLNTVTFVMAIVLVIAEMVFSLFIPTISAAIINNGVINGDIDYIIRYGVLMFAVALVVAGVSLANGYLAAKLSATLSMNLRQAIFDKSQEMSVSDFNQFSTGSMITRTSSDINQIQQAFIMILQILFPIPIIAVVSGFLTFSINVTIGFMVLFFAVLTLVFAFFIVKKAIPVFSKLQSLLDSINSRVRSFLTGVRVIRAFNREAGEQEKVSQAFQEYTDTAIRSNRLFALMNSGTFLIMNVATVAILFFGGIQISYGTMKIGDIVAVTEYVMMFLFYLVMGQMVMTIIPRARVSMQRVLEVLMFTPSITDQDTSVSSRMPAKVAVSFNHASFRYPDSENEVVSDLTFECLPGEITAIIGGTGSGKSTIASLIVRLHETTGGSILFNDINITELSQREVRDQVAYVPQKAFLFSGTIKDNLTFAKADATENEMLKSLEIASALQFVTEMPEGLLSAVSQGGTNFSGGQKQRLSIARAIIKAASIYVFDDCFSALDFTTEAKVRRALHPLTKEATVIIVAQRVSSIRHADQIIVLDEGRIVGKGKHADLLEQSAVYRQIVESQEREGGSIHE